MSIRSISDLEAHLTSDLKWRKGELFSFEQLLKKSRDHEKKPLLRGSFALIYSHWEGYVKSAGLAYLEYVSRKNLSLSDLRPELAAVALRNSIESLAAAKMPEHHTRLVVTLRNSGSEKVRIPYESATIRTHANLNYELFDQIMHSLGCDGAPFSTKANLIDERLLGRRNMIAHGEYLDVDESDWIEARDAVEMILGDVRTQLANAASLQTYRSESGLP